MAITDQLLQSQKKAAPIALDSTAPLLHPRAHSASPFYTNEKLMSPNVWERARAIKVWMSVPPLPWAV
jgi:hypothetical protein